MWQTVLGLDTTAVLPVFKGDNPTLKSRKWYYRHEPCQSGNTSFFSEGKQRACSFAMACHLVVHRKRQIGYDTSSPLLIDRTED